MGRADGPGRRAESIIRSMDIRQEDS